MRRMWSGTAAFALSLAAAFAAPSEAPAKDPFSHQDVIEQARALSSRGFAPALPVPAPLEALKYPDYRQIRFNKEQAIWRDEKRIPFSLEGFAPGFLFKNGVELFLVQAGEAKRVNVRPGMFSAPSPAVSSALQQFGAFSGFRVHHPINRRDYADEFLVFQGGSYFRAVSKGQSYGLSARGLAIDVAESTGEEFPFFKRFWIERPEKRAKSITIHALLDSPRVTGAYLFDVTPGEPTRMLVKATLFPREDLKHVGLGVLTSMFMFGPQDMPDSPDYRPAVHDSDGLAIERASGEQLWRPLHNPRTLEVSVFSEENPRGFGLIQRTRDFEAFQDAEAHYETRPSAWIEPIGEWGKGAVVLVEIPSDSETNDNIVTYWRPAQTLKKGEPFALSYELSWPDDRRPEPLAGRVVRTGYGRKILTGEPQYAIDYQVTGELDLDAVSVEASVGALEQFEVVKVPLPEPGQFRLFVTYAPDGLTSAELRVLPKVEGTPLGETWLSRWNRR